MPVSSHLVPCEEHDGGLPPTSASGAGNRAPKDDPANNYRCLFSADTRADFRRPVSARGLQSKLRRARLVLVGLRPVAKQIAARGRLCAGVGWPGLKPCARGALYGLASSLVMSRSRRSSLSRPSAFQSSRSTDCISGKTTR